MLIQGFQPTPPADPGRGSILPLGPLDQVSGDSYSSNARQGLRLKDQQKEATEDKPSSFYDPLRLRRSVISEGATETRNWQERPWALLQHCLGWEVSRQSFNLP